MLRLLYRTLFFMVLYLLPVNAFERTVANVAVRFFWLLTRVFLLAQTAEWIAWRCLLFFWSTGVVWLSLFRGVPYLPARFWLPSLVVAKSAGVERSTPTFCRVVPVSVSLLF